MTDSERPKRERPDDLPPWLPGKTPRSPADDPDVPDGFERIPGSHVDVPGRGSDGTPAGGAQIPAPGTDHPAEIERPKPNEIEDPRVKRKRRREGPPDIR